MKNFRKLCAAILLVCMFALPALAGDVLTPPGEVNAPPGETPGSGRMSDPETPGRAANVLSFQMKLILASILESVF
jgi:hypothetical protein